MILHNRFYCDALGPFFAYLRGGGTTWRTLIVEDWVHQREVAVVALPETLKAFRLAVRGDEWAAGGVLVPSDQSVLVTDNGVVQTGRLHSRYAGAAVGVVGFELHEVVTNPVTGTVEYYVNNMLQPRLFPDGSVLPWRQLSPELVWGEGVGGYQHEVINGRRYRNSCRAGDVVIGQCNNRTEGVVLTTGEVFLVSQEEWMDPRLACVEGRYFACSWLPGERVEVVELPPFAVPPPERAVPVINRPLWFGPFRQRVAAPAGVGNCEVKFSLPFTPGRKVITSMWWAEEAGEDLLAVWCGEHQPEGRTLRMSIEESRPTARRLRRPCAIYTDARLFDHSVMDLVEPDDYLLIQCYRDPGESVRDFRMSITNRVIDTLPDENPVILVAGAFTRNDTLTVAEVEEALVTIAEIAADETGVVRGVLYFATGRAQGPDDHPELHSLLERIYTGVDGEPDLVVVHPPPPTPPPQPVPPPEVSMFPISCFLVGRLGMALSVDPTRPDLVQFYPNRLNWERVVIDEDGVAVFVTAQRALSVSPRGELSTQAPEVRGWWERGTLVVAADGRLMLVYAYPWPPPDAGGSGQSAPYAVFLLVDENGEPVRRVGRGAPVLRINGATFRDESDE